MTEVWFIRHGESLSNAGHVVERTATTPLTELGHAQALRVSQSFNKAPDLIVVTPYLRTQLTAIPTLERFPSARRDVWPLHEFSCLSLANYANTTRHQRAPFVKSYWNRRDPDYIDGEGAESFRQMMGRIAEGLNRLRSAPETFITVFTHGHIMRTLRFMIEYPHLSADDLISVMPEYIGHTEIENCSIIRAAADAQGVRLHQRDSQTFRDELLGLGFSESLKKKEKTS